MGATEFLGGRNQSSGQSSITISWRALFFEVLATWSFFWPFQVTSLSRLRCIPLAYGPLFAVQALALGDVAEPQALSQAYLAGSYEGRWEEMGVVPLSQLPRVGVSRSPGLSQREWLPCSLCDGSLMELLLSGVPPASHSFMPALSIESAPTVYQGLW